MRRCAVVDVGLGNLRSVQKAAQHAADRAGAACEVIVTGDPGVIVRADQVIMPGQGAFRDCAAALEGGIGDALREQINRGTPYLGICLGLQALFERSDEAPGAAGLGLFAGVVERLPSGAVDPDTGAPVKIPHMGWNRLTIHRRGAGPLAVFDDDPAPYVYFVHSYHPVPADPSLVVATAQHGPYRVTAAIQRGNVTATQFHPEKSQERGLRLLSAFMKG